MKAKSEIRCRFPFGWSVRSCLGRGATNTSPEYRRLACGEDREQGSHRRHSQRAWELAVSRLLVDRVGDEWLVRNSEEWSPAHNAQNAMTREKFNRCKTQQNRWRNTSHDTRSEWNDGEKLKEKKKKSWINKHLYTQSLPYDISLFF